MVIYSKVINTKNTQLFPAFVPSCYFLLGIHINDIDCTMLFVCNFVGDFRQSFCSTEADAALNSGILEDALPEVNCDLFKIMAF